MACPGDEPGANASYFGIPSMELLGETGYADFLYAIADNGFVNRGGELKDTGYFIDSLTQNVKVLFVFFTPKEGLTSILLLSADMSGPLNVQVEFELKHYGMLEGSNLLIYLVCQSIVLANVGFMMFDAVLGLIKGIEG